MNGLLASRPIFLALVLALFVGGLAQIAYRHLSLGVPLLPSANRDVWYVDAKVEFRATGEPVTVSLALPETQTGFTVLRENLVSPGYGLSIVTTPENRRAEWTIAQARGDQELYYKVQLANDNRLGDVGPISAMTAETQSLLLNDAEATAADQVLADVRARSTDSLSFARQLTLQLTSNDPNQSIELLRSQYDTSELMVALLARAGVSSRVVYGLLLEDGRRRQRLKPYVHVYANAQWTLFDVRTGLEGRDPQLVLWAPSAESTLDVVGGRDSDLTFSILRQEENALGSVLTQIEDLGFDDFSIYQLPLEEQALLKGMFLIPIGAMVVVFMRIIVGLRTSGTFMPVLLAIAFTQTDLIPGLISFVVIVGAGLFVRSYLSEINLLLVARISATLIVVIGLMILFTLLSASIGLDALRNFAFFPLVIMSWTIERMSVLWEEEGPREVFLQTTGSLFVAVLAYLAMTMPFVRHMSFNFLGLQLVMLSLILVMGQYTGYRLVEVVRFKSLAGNE